MPGCPEPQLLLITVAPSCRAVRCAGHRYWFSEFVAWTTRILHVGHAALAMSTSSAVSTVQSSVAGGSGGSVAEPSSRTTRRQPFARVHGGRPYCERYIARSLS